MITDKLKTAGYYVLLKTTTPFPFPSPVAQQTLLRGHSYEHKNHWLLLCQFKYQSFIKWHNLAFIKKIIVHKQHFSIFN